MGLDAENVPRCPGCNRPYRYGQETCMWCGEKLPEVQAPDVELTCPCCASSQLVEQKGESWMIHTCEECGGLWMNAPILKRFEKFYDEAVREAAKPGGPKRVRVAEGIQDAAPLESLYRACPECGQQMARRRYKRISDVVVDECMGHGVWFDAEEFERVIAFLQAGGLEASRRFEAQTQAATTAFSKELSDLRRTVGRSGYYASRAGGIFF